MAVINRCTTTLLPRDDDDRTICSHNSQTRPSTPIEQSITFITFFDIKSVDSGINWSSLDASCLSSSSSTAVIRYLFFFKKKLYVIAHQAHTKGLHLALWSLTGTSGNDDDSITIGVASNKQIHASRRIVCCFRFEIVGIIVISIIDIFVVVVVWIAEEFDLLWFDACTTNDRPDFQLKIIADANDQHIDDCAIARSTSHHRQRSNSIRWTNKN